MLKRIREKAAETGAVLIFPEGFDGRIRDAAEKVRGLGIRSEIMEGNSEDSASAVVRAAELVAGGEFDGMVAGAATSTASVIRASIKKIGLEEDTSVISSFFLMEGDNRDLGENGAYLFADCAVIPDPNADKLHQIALQTARSGEQIMEWEPRVAFLSFSTKGSAHHPSVKKVREAVSKLRRLQPGFIFDGELQLDTAIVPEVARIKDPEGILQGRANVLVFPDLNSANIGYKLVQRIGGLRAVGPVMQGFRKPVNDLSRGCSVQDIIDVACFTAVQSGISSSTERKAKL